MKRSFKEYTAIFFKGIAMGAADVVPGVSGGTIAFITGIYEELIESISAFNIKTLQDLKNKGVKSVWKTINGNFLISLLLGIFLSVISLARGISYLLENEPVLLWSFFFGLVLASVFFVGKQIQIWNFRTISFLLLAVFTAYYITTLEPLAVDDGTWWFLFLSGALAVCAMILPGISGSFILVLLGSYKIVLEALYSKNIQVIVIVACGAITGLLGFSKILKYLFHKYKNITLASLTGFILGSLNKIWPWKQTLSWRTNSKGLEVPLSQKSVGPLQFDGDHQLMPAILVFIVGCVLIFFLDRTTRVKN